jgi:hypothetical protein
VEDVFNLIDKEIAASALFNASAGSGINNNTSSHKGRHEEHPEPKHRATM